MEGSKDHRLSAVEQSGQLRVRVLGFQVYGLVDQKAHQQSVHRYVKHPHEYRGDRKGRQSHQNQHQYRLLNVLANVSHKGHKYVKQKSSQSGNKNFADEGQEPTNNRDDAEPERVGSYEGYCVGG